MSRDHQELPVTYTTAEVSKIIHRTEETVRRLIKEGKIPAVRVGGRYLVTKETVDKLLRGDISTDD